MGVLNYISLIFKTLEFNPVIPSLRSIPTNILHSEKGYGTAAVEVDIKSGFCDCLSAGAKFFIGPDALSI